MNRDECNVDTWEKFMRKSRRITVVRPVIRSNDASMFLSSEKFNFKALKTISEQKLGLSLG